MRLCVDIGNAETVLGLVQDREVVAHWRVATDERRTPDEWGLLTEAVLARGVRTQLRAAVTGVAVSATVPHVLQTWREMLSAFYPELPHVIVGPGVRSGLPLQVENPREVGADRIANAVAAQALYPGPSITVDFGTATTFDVVNAQGAYVGGAIAPGVELAAQALGRRGAQLRQIELQHPRAAIAKNTVEALRSGVVLGAAAQVEGLVARMRRELGMPFESARPGGGDLHVLATGSLAPFVMDATDVFTAHRPLLTLLGVDMIFERNQ